MKTIWPLQRIGARWTVIAILGVLLAITGLILSMRQGPSDSDAIDAGSAGEVPLELNEFPIPVGSTLVFVEFDVPGTVRWASGLSLRPTIEFYENEHAEGWAFQRTVGLLNEAIYIVSKDGVPQGELVVFSEQDPQIALNRMLVDDEVAPIATLEPVSINSLPTPAPTLTSGLPPYLEFLGATLLYSETDGQYLYVSWLVDQPLIPLVQAFEEQLTRAGVAYEKELEGDVYAFFTLEGAVIALGTSADGTTRVALQAEQQQ